jgi:Xanthine and CO dehydrogenases maturation factor, XdhC/CoxF family
MPGFGEVIHSLESQRKPYAIATIVRVEGSSIAKPGFKIVVDQDGRVLYGTLGGVCPEGPVISVAMQAIRDERPRVLTVHLVGPEESLKMMAEGLLGGRGLRRDLLRWEARDLHRAPAAEEEVDRCGAGREGRRRGGPHPVR